MLQNILLTLLSPFISEIALLELKNELKKNQCLIINMDHLQNEKVMVYQILVSTNIKEPLKTLQSILFKFRQTYNLDTAIQPESFFNNHPKLLILDADMTFIQCEVIDELAKLAGKEEEVSNITKKAMNGEVDFTQSLLKRVSCLKGLPVERMEHLKQTLPYTTGIETFIFQIKKLGFKVGILSGGFQFFIDICKQKFHLDYGIANQLEIKEGKLTGKVTGNIINAEQKANILEKIAIQENIDLQHTVTIGDGANDLLMFKKSAYSIAFNAKKIVQQNALATLNQSDISLCIHYLIKNKINKK